MVFNATINNIKALSWRSVLLVEETGEKKRSIASHCQTLSHTVASSTPRHERGGTDTLWVIGNFFSNNLKIVNTCSNVIKTR